MLHAIDRSALSIDRAVPSRDLLLAQASTDGQPSMDRVALSMDEHRPVLSGCACAIDGSSRPTTSRNRLILSTITARSLTMDS